MKVGWLRSRTAHARNRYASPCKTSPTNHKYMILNENPKRTFQLDCRKVITLIMLICVLFSCSIFKKKNVKYNTSIFDTMPGTGGKFGSAIIEFELKIPKDYNHLTQIDSFVNRNQATWIIGWQFSDKNFFKIYK